MHPIVGLRLTHMKLQRLHRLEGMGFLIDQNKQEFVSPVLQDSFGPPACAALAWFTGTRQLIRIPLFIGALKRR